MKLFMKATELAPDMIKQAIAALSVLVLNLSGYSAFACPIINRLIDLNCDQRLRIAATGDSITYGVGDNNLTEDNGGWVQDLGLMFPRIEASNLGVPGATSNGLYRAFRRNAYRGKETTEKLRGSDVVFLEVGTNNFWTYRPPESVIRDIKRLRNFLGEFFTAMGEPVPIIVVATLPPTKRGFQQPFIDSVNQLLLLPSNVESLNVRVRFDTLGTGIISSDNLHPTPRGYRTMAKVVRKALLSDVKAQALYKVGDDLDQDGVYDTYELSKFLTDPANPDTDGDGFTDGQELFELFTDPLSATVSLTASGTF